MRVIAQVPVCYLIRTRFQGDALELKKKKSKNDTHAVLYWFC